MSALWRIRTITYKSLNICTNNDDEGKVTWYLVFDNDGTEHAHLLTMADCRNYIDMATQKWEYKTQIVTLSIWTLAVYFFILL